MSGADTLVPPTIPHPPVPPGSVQYVATPVDGFPIAATSASIRFGQLGSACQVGLGISALHPLPPPFHALSAQPREDEDRLRVVPPTATTPAEVAGYAAPKPLSPAETVIRIPGRV